MRFPSFSHRASQVAPILLSLLFLATAPPSAQAECQSYDTVQIQLKWLQQAQFAGYQVAVENSFYKEQCLEVYIRPGGPNINMEQEVIANRAQFGIDWMASMLTQREAGSDVVLISQVFARTANVQITWQDQNLRKPTDLTGKNVCTWLGGNELSFRALLDANHMVWDNDTSANQWPGASENVISQSFTEAQFLNGECVAASAMRYNEMALVLETTNPATGQLYQMSDLYLFDYNYYNVSSYEDGIFVSKDWLAQPGNRDIAVRFLRGSMKGWMWARDFPDQAVALVYSRSVHQTWMLNEVSKLIFPTWTQGFGIADVDALQMSADRVLRYGLISKRANVSEFYRSDIAVEALQGYMASVIPGWPADDSALGSSDVFGETFVGRDLSFCMNADQLAICEGGRTQDKADQLHFSYGAGAALTALAAAALLVIVAIAGALVFYRNSKNIVAASLPFCLLICLGGSIFVASIFFSIGSAFTNYCHARIWFLCIGFTTMLGSFVIKVKRIDTIFNSSTLTAKKLPNQQLFVQLLVLLSVEVLLLSLFSGLSGFEDQTYNDSYRGQIFHHTCRITHSKAGDAMTALLFSYKALLLIAATVLAYRTQNVTSAYNEAKYLAIAVYNITLVSLVVVPIVAFLDMTPDVKFIVADIGVLFAVTFSVAILFVPKIIAAFLGNLPLEDGATMVDGTKTGTNRRSFVAGSGQTMLSGYGGNNSSAEGNAPPSATNGSVNHNQWMRALKTLPKDTLVAHLRRFRQQSEQIRTELKLKGLTDDAIDELMEDRSTTTMPSTAPTFDRRNSSTSKPPPYSPTFPAQQPTKHVPTPQPSPDIHPPLTPSAVSTQMLSDILPSQSTTARSTSQSAPVVAPLPTISSPRRLLRVHLQPNADSRIQAFFQADEAQQQAQQLGSSASGLAPSPVVNSQSFSTQQQ